MFLKGAEYALNNQYINVEDDLPCFHKELFDGTETKHVVTLDSNGDIHLDYMIYYFTKWEWNRKDANILFWFSINATITINRGVVIGLSMFTIP